VRTVSANARVFVHGRDRARVLRLSFMAIRDMMEKELAAWATARRALAVAKRAADDDPDNPVRKAQLDRATIEARESTDFLRAALTARGFSLDQLQSELRAGA
jgi:hypothetical protein